MLKTDAVSAQLQMSRQQTSLLNRCAMPAALILGVAIGIKGADLYRKFKKGPKKEPSTREPQTEEVSRVDQSSQATSEMANACIEAVAITPIGTTDQVAVANSTILQELIENPRSMSLEMFFTIAKHRPEILRSINSDTRECWCFALFNPDNEDVWRTLIPVMPATTSCLKTLLGKNSRNMLGKNSRNIIFLHDGNIIFLHDDRTLSKIISAFLEHNKQNEFVINNLFRAIHFGDHYFSRDIGFFDFIYLPYADNNEISCLFSDSKTLTPIKPLTPIMGRIMTLLTSPNVIFCLKTTLTNIEKLMALEMIKEKDVGGKMEGACFLQIKKDLSKIETYLKNRLSIQLFTYLCREHKFNSYSLVEDLLHQIASFMIPFAFKHPLETTPS